MDQTLIDDEWHAVHQVLLSSPSRFMLSFGHADYSIPLTLLYWLQAQFFELTELGMRLPMMIAGVASIVFFPLALRKQFNDRVVLSFAFLVASSPLLISFSRMARPYALTLFLSFCALACLVRAVQALQRGTPHWKTTSAYVMFAALSLWLHPITGPFLVAPLVILWWGCLRGRSDSPSLRYLCGLTIATGAAMGLAVLPPLLSDPSALSGKSGIDAVNFSTVTGVWYAWLGNGSTAVVISALCLAAIGATTVWRASQIVRWAIAGILLTAFAVLVTKPAWIFNPLTFARYLLPTLPILLLCVAAGLDRVLAKWIRKPMRPMLLFCVLLGGALTSPLGDQLRVPNSNTLHIVAQVDFRESANPIKPHLAKFPVSPFWTSLATAPPDSIRVAVAPFRFESFDWPAPVWEAISKQRVLPAYLTETCEAWLHGNLPRVSPSGSRFRFRNAVNVGDLESLRRGQISYLAYFRAARNSLADPQSPYLPHCEAWMRGHLGPPYFDDASLVVWKVRYGEKL